MVKNFDKCMMDEAGDLGIFDVYYSLKEAGYIVCYADTESVYLKKQ